MIVPFSISDFLDRAAHGLRRPGRRRRRARPAGAVPGRADLRRAGDAGAPAQAAHLDQLGIGVGERVAVVSHNSARLLAVVLRRRRLRPGAGAGELPAAARRGALHRRALRRPGAVRRPRARRGAGRRSTAEHRFVLGDDDAPVRRRAARSRGRGSRTRTPPRASTTPPARPRAPRACRSPTATSGSTPSPSALHAGVTDRDVYLHTLPMFHANGWGMPFAMTGLGVPQVVLRKVDGAEILRRVERHGVTVMCAAPAVAAAVLEAAQDWEGEIPGPGPGADHHGRRPAADEDRGAGRGGARLGVRPDLRPHRDLAAADDQPQPRRVGRPRRPRSGPHRLVRAGAPALGVRLKVDESDEGPARCWPAPTSCSRATGSSPRSRRRALRGRLVPHRRRRVDRRRRLPHDPGPQEGRHHHRRRERHPRSRSRTCSSPTRPSPRWR